MSTTTRKFKTVITDTGAKKLAQAAAPDGKPVRLTHMAVGDGGGTLPTPDSKQTCLVHEVWRHTVNRVILDATHQNRIIAELVIPPETGGFWIREIGVFDEHGDLIAVGNTAESYKPAVAEGSGRAQTFRTILTVSSTATVALTVDNTMVMATVDYVDNKLKEHEQSRRHPDASLTAKGFVQLSSATNSDSETLAATPKAVKVAYDLANGKYTAQDATTARKGLVQLSSATNSTSETLAATSNAVKAAYDNAEKRLQKAKNGEDISDKDTFTKNIGACRAYSAELNIGGDSEAWTTAQLIFWLESQGAFNHPYWMCKGSWAYASNKVITDTGCGNICLAGAVVEVIGTRGAMTIRVTTSSTSSGGGITNAQFTYINHGDAYAPGWRRDYNTKNQQPAFALGQTGRRVANDKAVGWNWNSGVYDADISGASTLILHFNMNAGSCPAVQFRVNYRNGGIFYRSARDGYGFEANWSEFYTTTRKPSAGDVGAYTQAECNSRFITGIRLGGLSSVQTWKGPGWSDRSGYVVTGSVNGNRDELIDTTQARPIQYCINGTWYNAGSI